MFLEFLSPSGYKNVEHIRGNSQLLLPIWRFHDSAKGNDIRQKTRSREGAVENRRNSPVIMRGDGVFY